MALSVRKALEYLSSQEDECEEAAYTRKGKEDPDVVCDLSFVSHLVQGSARVNARSSIYPPHCRWSFDEVPAGLYDPKCTYETRGADRVHIASNGSLRPATCF